MGEAGCSPSGSGLETQSECPFFGRKEVNRTYSLTVEGYNRDKRQDHRILGPVGSPVSPLWVVGVIHRCEAL